MAPGWFRKALNTPFQDCYAWSGSHRIHYMRWESILAADQAHGVILVHGSGAHAHWWAFIAPFLLEGHRVVAVDLAGMGDSDHRETYGVDELADDLIVVADDAGFGDDTIIIGHSFGGFVALKAGVRHAERLTGVVLVDSPIRPPDYGWERDPKRSPIRPKRVYPDFETALGRFRLMPPQDCRNDFILDYIARHSLVEVNSGWSWKFDDRMFHKLRFGEANEDRGKALASLHCRVAVVYGEDSYLFDQGIVNYMFDVLDKSVPFIALPEAQHHLFLDQPMAFIAVMRTLLAEWRHSKPNRGAHIGLAARKL